MRLRFARYVLGRVRAHGRPCNELVEVAPPHLQLAPKRSARLPGWDSRADESFCKWLVMGEGARDRHAALCARRRTSECAALLGAP